MQETWKKDACWIRIFLTNGVIGAPRRHGVKMILKWGVPLLRYSFLTNKMISSIFLIFPFFLFCPFIFFFLSFLSTQRKKENENLLRKFHSKKITALVTVRKAEEERIERASSYHSNPNPIFRVMGLTIWSWRRPSSLTYSYTTTLLSFFWRKKKSKY